MNRYKKGEYGYLKNHRKNKLLASSAFVLMIVFIVVTTIIMFGDTKRVTIVFAILLALPLAKFFIAYILCAGFKPLSNEDYSYIKEKTGDDFSSILFDISITKYEGAKFYPAMLIKNGKLYAFVYSEKLKDNKKDYELWITDAISSSKYEYKVVVTDDIDVFIKKVTSVSEPNHNNKLIDKHIKELIFDRGV